MVRLSSAMGFPETFTRLQQKLQRQLNGKDVLSGIAFRFEGDQSSYLVDDEDMWEEVLARIKTTGATELMGTLSDGEN